MRTGRKPKNQQTRAGIAKTWHRFGPVLPIQVGAALDLADLAAMRNQTRTERAGNDFCIERNKIGRRRIEFYRSILAGIVRHLLQVYQRPSIRVKAQAWR